MMRAPMQVPLLDLKPQFQSLKSEILPRITELLETQEMVLGPAVERFETAIGKYTGAPHAVGMSSGTDAILAVLMALGIGPGDAVITTPYSFFATAGCIHRTGAEPVFADIDPETFNLCPKAVRTLIERDCCADEKGELRSPSGNRIKAILPVHLFGQCCDLDALAEIACRQGLPLVEDAAQALGAVYPAADGTTPRAGTYGAFGCYSFYPTKNLGGIGDGGLAVCREDSMGKTLRCIRNHGMEERYLHLVVGGNFRLDAIQAAVLEIKLRHLDAWSLARRRNAALYREHFSQLGLDRHLSLPIERHAGAGDFHHIYNQFVVRAPRRAQLMEHLQREGVGHAVYYPVPLHLQPCFAGLNYRRGDFPEAERAAEESLALPIFPELSPGQIATVAGAVARFY